MARSPDDKSSASAAESIAQTARIYSPQNVATWKRTWLKFGPITGLIALVIAILCILASLVVLVVSDGSPTSKWRFSPSVYLGIASAIANAAIRYSSLEGVVIAWWTRASKGSTFSKLHTDWRTGTSLIGAIVAGRNIGFLGLACIISSVVIIDGPLLQSSSTVSSAAIRNEFVPLNITLVPEIPNGFTGSWLRINMTDFGVCDGFWGHTIPSPYGETKNNICTAFHNDLIEVATSMLNPKPLEGLVTGCKGTCHAKVKAPALAVSACTVRNIVQNFSHSWDEHSYDTEMLLRRTAFMRSVEPYDGQERLNLLTGFVARNRTSPQINRDCTGVFQFNTCILDSAVGLYNVDISQDTLVLTEPVKPEIIAIANNTKVPVVDGDGAINSTLMGIQALFSVQDAALDQVFGWKPLSAGIQGPLVAYIVGVHGTCLSFRDPWEETLQRLNQYMFQIGVRATHAHSHADIASRIDPGLEISSKVNGTVTGSQSVFNTDYAYFAGAATVELICILFILPTYWGWWRFGRKITFSPLEIAKAFEAPLLADCDSNSSGTQLAKSMDYQPVRYAVVVDDSRPSKDEVNKLCFTVIDSPVRYRSRQILS